MPTVTVPRADVTSEQVSAALRKGLDARYNVLPGTRMTRNPFGDPRPGGPDAILVGIGANILLRAQVRIIRRPDSTDIRISPGGVTAEYLLNMFGIARRVSRVLLDAPDLSSPQPR